MANTMQQTDAISGGLAECHLTIDGNRYNFMQMTDFEATYEPNIVDVPILGRTTVGKKMVGGSGSFSGTAYYNNSIFRKAMLSFHKTGVFPEFEIQVSSEDKGSSIGRQTTLLKGCLLDSIIVAKFAAGEDLLDEDISGTFWDWDLEDTFDNLAGMEV